MFNSKYKRPAPPLPPVELLPFPANFIRGCTACDLRSGCRAPVPPSGPIPAYVMAIGEGPGVQEDEWGFRPFCGAAGHQLDALLVQSQSGLTRDEIFITNTFKCHVPNDGDPKPYQVAACAHWLDLEIGLVQPKIIVAMGAFAIRRLLGSDAGSVEQLHGRPIIKNICGADRIVLPSYHPAAGLHQTNVLRFLREDFQVLQGLLSGVSVAEYNVEDEYPNPDYRILDTPAKQADMIAQMRESGQYGVDTEQVAGKLWSVQFSAIPGTGWFLPIKDSGRINLGVFPGSPIVHYYQHDSQYLDIPDGRFTDTMTQAYLLQLSQGLKELAHRICGVKMQSYSDLVRPGQRILSLQYITEALTHEWPDPPTLEVAKWDNKVGKVVVKQRKPWHITRKMKNILSDMAKGLDVDPLDRWKNIELEERACVESKLGKMPESSLVDVPYEQAVMYSVRDADVTLRVKLKLEKLIADMGLSFVLNMDLGILPMVREMMKNGMAVDVEHFKLLSKDYSKRMAEKAEELASMVGHPFNPNSRPQVATVVYSELGFQHTAFTNSGEISTDDQELKKTKHPVATGVIEYRRLSKMKGTYADNMVDLSLSETDGTYRIHTELKTTRTETGRLSSANPNLQNVPARSEEGKLIKNGFIAPRGRLLLEVDYGQIEMVVQAHMAKCKYMIDYFLAGKDPHTMTASSIFGISYEDAKQKKYRYPAKTMNFQIIYLVSGRGLSEQISEYVADLQSQGVSDGVEAWSPETCNEYIAKWYKVHPEVRAYQQEMAAHARRYGYVKDMFGRIRYIPEVMSPIRSVSESGLKMAANMPIQAGAQGIMKLAMAQAWKEYVASPWRDQVRWGMQIHDSLIAEIPEDEDFILGFTQWLGGIMTSVVKLLVPIKVDFKVGKNWGEMSKFPKEEKK